MAGGVSGERLISSLHLGCRIDRSVAVKDILARFEQGVPHVHLHGPPGYGKSDVVRALVEAGGDRVVLVQLQKVDLHDADLLRAIASALLAPSRLQTDWPTNNWAAGWEIIAKAIDKKGLSAKPILILDSAEWLFDAHHPQPWPADIIAKLHILTVSAAPLHLFHAAVSREAAEAISVALRAFPIANDDDYGGRTGRLEAQSEEDYQEEGTAWFDRYKVSRPSVDPGHEARLETIFKRKHLARRDDIWDGHPLLNIAVLERMLDAVLKGRDPRTELEDFRSDLGSLSGKRSDLRDRLLPFLDGAADAASPTLVQEVADAVIRLADGRPLDARSIQWITCSGLARPLPAGGCEWTKVATLLANVETEAGRSDIRRWAERHRLAARDRQRRLEDVRHQADRDFEACRDDVRRIFCDSDIGLRLDRRIEPTGRTRPVVPGQVYAFELSYRTEDRGIAGKSNAEVRAPVDLLVFETGTQGTRFWRNYVRLLSILGRLRHPALPQFRRGGELRSNDEPASNDGRAPARVFVEVQYSGQLLDSRNLPKLNELVATLRSPLRGDSTVPLGVFEQVVSLAEALDLIHAQGLLHRSIDFGALAIGGGGGQTQLIITGFEHAVNLRSLLAQHGNRDDTTIWRLAPWNLACRAPEAAVAGQSVIDPSVDVYAFGALATMLMTGLPGEDVLTEVDRLLPTTLGQKNAAEVVAQSDGLADAVRVLQLDLRRPDRWTPEDEPLQVLLNACIDDEPSRRPVMEHLAASLGGLLRDRARTSGPADEVLYVSYPDRDMARMLKRLELIDEDMEVESPEGRAKLRSRIQQWLDECRWMHYREEGFPKQGDQEAERTRANSKYIFAGPGIVFFAGPYLPAGSTDYNWNFLWLGYAMRRHEMHLPDPDGNESLNTRIVTENVTWVGRPRRIEVVAQSDLPRLRNLTSWEATRRELEERGKLDSARRLGREAATVWRVHRDILLALEAMRNFPVRLQKLGKMEYEMELDEDAFRRLNERGQYSFLRQVILEGRNPRAFFANTISSLADDAQGDRLGLKVFPRGPQGRARRALPASVDPPVGEKVTIRFDDDIPDQLPRNAGIVWSDSVGTQIAANRQGEAISRLEQKSWLMNYVVMPRDCGTLEPPISAVCGLTLEEAPQDRIDELRDRIKLMLASDPLHAVQGPPGTGKTTLISALADEVVRAQDGSRMLITSQSHAATDNVVLAVSSVLDKVAKRDRDESTSSVPAVRLYSERSGDSVDAEVRRRYGIDAQVRQAMARMQESCKRHAAQPGSALERAVERLKSASDNGYLEIRTRIERSAPLVFSTTGAAITAGEYLRRGMPSYDYAVIDEAAKAWAIDLIQPMALADRAILVGDQAQLPPFGDIELDKILRNAQMRRSLLEVPPEIHFLLDASRTKDGGEAPFDRMKGWLKLFHRVFEKRPPITAGANEKSLPLTQSLNRQFRSVPAIGTIVSATFYNHAILNAGPDPRPDQRILIPAERHTGPFAPAVVWIDTSQCKDPPYYSRNSGSLINAGEAEIVGRLLSALLPLREKSWERLRVLSPYKAQVQYLINKYYGRSDLFGLSGQELPRIFQTVDSSQGSEADIVVISLCRRNRPLAPTSGAPDTPPRQDELKRRIDYGLGFLQQPERLNVMMSRARQQLVLVGDFAYYAAGAEQMENHRRLDSTDGIDGPGFWKKLQSAFDQFDPQVHPSVDGQERPVIVDARSLLLTAR